MEHKGDNFWGENVEILWNKDRLSEFFPLSHQTLEERVNALTRLIIYISTVVAFYKSNGQPIQFGIFLLLVIYILWNNRGKVNDTVIDTIDSNLEETENFEPAPIQCTKPTKENPFMNVLYGDPLNKPPPCQDPGTQETASNLLRKQLFMDTDDLFDKRSNERLFLTTPASLVPDREKYANWLIGGITDCKTDGFCPESQDLRYDRRDKPNTVAGFYF
jgi:hypothetical protein